MSIDRALLVLPLVIAHLPIVASVIAKLREGYFPRVVDFGALGIILYFDTGILIEFLGLEYANSLLPFFFEAEDWYQLFTVIVLMSTPYLYYLGARISNPAAVLVSHAPDSELIASRKFVFYSIILGLALSMGVWGLSFYFEDPLAVRLRFRQLNLPLNLFLLVPAQLLAFYVRQTESRTRIGLVITLILLCSAIMAVLPLSSRTALLLPILVFILFYMRMTPVRLIGVSAAAVIFAMLLLPLYSQPARWGRVTAPDEIEWQRQLQHIVFQDFYRAHVTIAAMERAQLLDTEIMSQPMSGYLYAALYFVPRSIAPLKGYSTAIYFGSNYLGYETNDDAVFGFGNSAIDEIILNAGILFLLPGLVLYGMLMGLGDRFSGNVPSLIVPTRLAALWSGGYVMAVLVHFFGSMFLICLALQLLFARAAGQKA